MNPDLLAQIPESVRNFYQKSKRAILLSATGTLALGGVVACQPVRAIESTPTAQVVNENGLVPPTLETITDTVASLLPTITPTPEATATIESTVVELPTVTPTMAPTETEVPATATAIPTELPTFTPEPTATEVLSDPNNDGVCDLVPNVFDVRVQNGNVYAFGTMWESGPDDDCFLMDREYYNPDALDTTFSPVVREADGDEIPVESLEADPLDPNSFALKFEGVSGESYTLDLNPTIVAEGENTTFYTSNNDEVTIVVN